MAYSEGIRTNLEMICKELEAYDCSRLEAMNDGLWVATAAQAPDVDTDRWFTTRERVIYFNLWSQLRDPGDIMYVHAGAFHAQKDQASAGSRLVHDYEPTRGRVVSIAVAWGEGSRSWYRQTKSLAPWPSIVAQALEGELFDPHLVPTNVPDASCRENPLTLRTAKRLEAPMGLVFDGLLHVRRLVPENRPETTTLALTAASVGALTQHMDDIRRLEGEVFHR